MKLETSFADTAPRTDARSIWNPDAAANWSLLFTPVFGAYIHMLNWQALGEPAKAARARWWLCAGLVDVAMNIVVDAMSARLNAEAPFVHVTTLLFLLVWYVFAAREQVRFVRTRFGDAYARMTWDRAVVLGLAAAAVFMCVKGLLSLLLVTVT